MDCESSGRPAHAEPSRRPRDGKSSGRPRDSEHSRRRLLAAVAGAAVALAGCTGDGTDGTSPTDAATPTDTDAPDPPALPVSGRWPQEGFDAGHAGVSPREGVPGDGRTYWQHRRIRSGPPVLADGRLYHYAELGADADGTVTPTPTPSSEDGPAHIVNGNPHLVARDAATGELAWWTPLSNTSAGPPAVAGDVVVFGGRGEVVAVDPATGERRWTDAFDPVAHEGSSLTRPVGTPTVADDAIIVPLPGVVDGDEYVVEPRVRAYDRDGTVRWTVRPPQRGLGVAAAPGADASTGEDATGGEPVAVVVARDYDDSTVVQARSLADGSVRWSVDLAGGFARAPVVAGGTAYVAGDELVALGLADGRERWRLAVDASGLAAGGQAVYVATGETLEKRAAADGSVTWRREADGGRFVAPPVVGAGVVYAGTRGGRRAAMVALDDGSGDRRWSVRLPSTVVEGDMVMAGVRNRPALGDGAVYVDAVDGLYGFGPR